jgi:hypothetical protein
MPLYYTGPLAFNQSYRWTSCGEEDCPECASLDGECKTLDQWAVTVMPGFHPGCDCSLVAAGLNEDNTTRYFARILNWMLDAGMFVHMYTNAPYSTFFKVFSARFRAGRSRVREEEEGPKVWGKEDTDGNKHDRPHGERRTFARTKAGDITTTSFTQPDPIVLSLDGSIVSHRYLNPRLVIPRVESIYASNRS